MPQVFSNSVQCGTISALGQSADLQQTSLSSEKIISVQNALFDIVTNPSAQASDRIAAANELSRWR